MRTLPESSSPGLAEVQRPRHLRLAEMPGKAGQGNRTFSCSTLAAFGPRASNLSCGTAPPGSSGSPPARVRERGCCCPNGASLYPRMSPAAACCAALLRWSSCGTFFHGDAVATPLRGASKSTLRPPRIGFYGVAEGTLSGALFGGPPYSCP